MRTRPFGALGDHVPVLGQGTWNMGDPRDRDGEREALRAGLELGLTHLDTAEMYGDGRAEELLAEALEGRRREDVFLVSKVLPRNAAYRQTIAACDRTLARLRVDYLDVYLLHWASSSVPIAETMGALEALVGLGKIRALGVSNFDVDELAEAERALTRERIVCNQVLYHLRERGIERRLLPYCAQRRIAVVGYSPFGSGSFPGEHTQGGKVLAAIAGRHGATPHQIALAFLIREPPLFAIPKAAKAAHVRENAGAGAISLTAEDLAAIDEEFPVAESALATL